MGSTNGMGKELAVRNAVESLSLIDSALDEELAWASGLRKEIGVPGSHVLRMALANAISCRLAGQGELTWRVRALSRSVGDVREAARRSGSLDAGLQGEIDAAYRLAEHCYDRCNLASRLCLQLADEYLQRKRSVISVRVERETKRDAQRLFGGLGLTLDEAIGMFLRKSLQAGGMPFDLAQPRFNEETEDAIQEARDIMGGKLEAKSYGTFDELLADIE